MGAILSIALLSVVLTVVRARTGRLLPCFVIHLVFNGVQSAIIVAEPYLRSVIERGQPKPAGTLTYLLHFLG
jgi:membrane protease YdiL (CAAX protease family)